MLQSYSNPEVEGIYEQVYANYMQQLVKAYQAGARNFVLIDTPNVQDSPMQLAQDGTRDVLERALGLWNGKLADLAADFQSKDPDVMATVFSSYKVFTRMYANSNEAGGSSGLKFWYDSLHPSSPVHEAVARSLAVHLRGIECT